MSLVQTLAFGISAAGLVTIVLATVVAHHWRLGLGLALDLWVGAGLLRLSGEVTWRGLATAATIVVLRHLVGYGLRQADRATEAAAPTPT